MPAEFRVTLLERAAEDGAVYGAKAVGEPPLMLAFSVREALREAAAAFGPTGHQVDLGCSGHARGRVLGRAGRAGRAARPQEAAAAVGDWGGGARKTSRTTIPRRAMHWLTAVTELRRARQPGVLVTVSAVRGHAPREAGAKMVVGQRRCWGTIGGGNLEQSAVVHARELLGSGAVEPETTVTSLSDRAPVRHGVQCCGGEVTLFFEPLRPVPAIAIFGMGHVGTELALVLARHDIELHLVDSRAAHVDAERLAPSPRMRWRGCTATTPWCPSWCSASCRSGSHVLIMTHDHAEDAALCDAALRCGHLGSIGLIGSAAKWARFRKRLTVEGHDAAALARITTPIGLPGIEGKQPATIAVSVAADLLRRMEREQAAGRLTTQEAAS